MHAEQEEMVVSEVSATVCVEEKPLQFDLREKITLDSRRRWVCKLACTVQDIKMEPRLTRLALAILRLFTK